MKIAKCRICGNPELIPIMDIGYRTFTGIFPKTRDQKISRGKLDLVKCSAKGCGLLQTSHSFIPEEMYGMNYGYRSGLNKSMVAHLRTIPEMALSLVDIKADDLIVDVGSNDGTLLSFYPPYCRNLAGIDPTSEKFKQYYEKRVRIIPDFFTLETFRKHYPEQKAKVISSIAMFYDLESPIAFMRDIDGALADNGIWIFEQSYAPMMIDNISYDTICHEHLEYYSLRQIKYMADEVGFKILAVEFNDANGGSFWIAVSKPQSQFAECTDRIAEILEKEKHYEDIATLNDFAQKSELHRAELLHLLRDLKKQGKTVLGYGASTKGNVILQYCEIGPDLLPCIADVNPDKFGSFTPETLIPIVSEQEAKAMNPDYFVVFPWHFRKGILEREQDFLARGGKLIFPLPSVEIVEK